MSTDEISSQEETSNDGTSDYEDSSVYMEYLAAEAAKDELFCLLGGRSERV